MPPLKDDEFKALEFLLDLLEFPRPAGAADSAQPRAVSHVSLRHKCFSKVRSPGRFHLVEFGLVNADSILPHIRKYRPCCFYTRLEGRSMCRISMLSRAPFERRWATRSR